MQALTACSPIFISHARLRVAYLHHAPFLRENAKGISLAVILGLDTRIHARFYKCVTVSIGMDGRVKPYHDGWGKFLKPHSQVNRVRHRQRANPYQLFRRSHLQAML
jgi:hypothetical protein